jgi:hypothetical protein
MQALRGGRSGSSGGASAPWTLLHDRSPPKGNPPGASTPRRSLVSFRVAPGERRVGAGAAGNRFGTRRCHRDPRLTPGPPAAVSFPGVLECQSGTIDTSTPPGVIPSFRVTSLFSQFLRGRGVDRTPKGRGGCRGKGTLRDTRYGRQ